MFNFRTRLRPTPSGPIDPTSPERAKANPQTKTGPSKSFAERLNSIVSQATLCQPIESPLRPLVVDPYAIFSNEMKELEEREKQRKEEELTTTTEEIAEEPAPENTTKKEGEPRQEDNNSTPKDAAKEKGEPRADYYVTYKEQGCFIEADKLGLGAPIKPRHLNPNEHPTFTIVKPGGESQKPYRNELKASVQKLKDFIINNTADQEDESTKHALSSLAEYSTRVESGDLSLLTLNESRRNLAIVCKTLENIQTPDDTCLTEVKELAIGLNTCDEGAALRIIEAIRNLTIDPAHSLAASILKTQNRMVNAALLAVVQQETSHWVDKDLVAATEIHNVEALKQITPEWNYKGPHHYPIEDKYINKSFQTWAGDLAKGVLELTITPENIAARMATDIKNSIESFTGLQLDKDVNLELLKNTHELATSLEVEFFKGINLHDYIKVSNDGKTVKFNPQRDIEHLLLKEFKKIGLIDKVPEPEHIAAKKCTVDQALKAVEPLRGSREYRDLINAKKSKIPNKALQRQIALNNAANNPNSSGVQAAGVTTTTTEDEEKRKKAEEEAALRQQEQTQATQQSAAATRSNASTRPTPVNRNPASQAPAQS